MTKKENQTTKKQLQHRELKLEHDEIMRLSLFKVNEKTVELCYQSDPKAEPATLLQGLMKVLESNFGMICVPKCIFGGMISVEFANEDNLEDILATMSRESDVGEGHDTKRETIH